MDETPNVPPITETPVEPVVVEAISPPAPAPAPKPTPKPAPKIIESKPKPQVPVERLYKLNVYSFGGTVKQSIPVSVYQDMCRSHGDIMRSISSTKWSTMDEILDEVWKLEKKMRYPANRTRKSVEIAIADLIEREFVSVR